MPTGLTPHRHRCRPPVEPDRTPRRMGLRVGVDVGGTFTKAIAFDLEASGVVAQAVTQTTHSSEHGVAAGVVDVVASIATDVGADRIDLVVHSTTQAVNALLEGDTQPVGVI